MKVRLRSSEIREGHDAPEKESVFKAASRSNKRDEKRDKRV